MKTLPEIVKLYSIDVAYAARRQKVGNLHQVQQLFIEAIAKELMGCLSEKIKYTGNEIMGIRIAVSEEAGHKLEFRMPKEIDAYNKALAEVRARLTAFIGKGE